MTIKPLQTASMFLTLLLLAVLPGCSTSPRAPDSQQALQGNAESAFASGKFELAARTWQQNARQVEPEQAAHFLVRATDAWLLADQPQQAEKLLRQINRANLASGDKARLDLVLADLALRNQRPDEAGQLLRQAKPNLPRDSSRRYERLSTQLNQLLSLPVSQDISRASTLSSSVDSYDPIAALGVIR